MSGVSGETLSKDQEEILEKKGASFIRSDQTIPSRFTSGVLIEIKIDEMACSLKDYKWGVVSAEEGEFVLPDTFGKWCIVPVTPTVCLVCNQVDTRIARHQVVELNRDAVQAAKQYFVARDFSQCPL